MKKKKRIIVISTVIAILLITLGINIVFPYIKPINSGVIWDDIAVSKEENNLLDFITSDLMHSDYGIKTNYNDEESQEEITKGFSVLAESQGLMLLYYIDINNKEEFDNTLKYIEDKMILDNGLLSWRVDDNESGTTQTNSTIDDLRVAKALLLAAEKWNEIEYRKIAFKISAGIKKELRDGNLLSDFYDGYNKSSKTTICFIDILSLRLLASLDNDYKKIYMESLNLLDRALINSEVPLYKKEYDRDKDEFDNENIDMQYNSVILLNRAQAGLDISNSINYLKKKYSEDNGIFAFYDTAGNVLSNIESTSIYSNLLQASSLAGDTELYDICKEKIIGYQVKDKNSKIFGAYGDPSTLEVYSFDNLNALLAWRKIRK